MPAKQKPLFLVTLAGGQSSSVTLHQEGKKKFVLKRSVRNTLKGERVALNIAKRSGIPVPAVLSYKDGNLRLEFIDGRNIRDTDLNDLFFRNLSAVLQRLHGITASKIGDVTSPKHYSEKNWFNFLKACMGRGIQYLIQHKNSTKTEGKKLSNCWVARFSRLPQRSFRPTLVHNDIHLDTILITKNKKLYLIDFEDSFYGDPLYDLVPFSDFHPRLFPKLKKYYGNKAIFGDGWKEWFAMYEFIHWVGICSFYVDIDKRKYYERYLSKIRNFAVKER